MAAGVLPTAVFGFYLLVSALAFAVYAVDKRAAQNDRRRVRETHLHALSLVGGWPGALAAQQALRHKSRKRSFQIVFWMTAVANCAVLVWFLR